MNYSATVAAEVYFKNLIAENSGKRRVRMEVERKGTGGGVRLVGKDVDGDEERSHPQSQGWGGILLAGGA